MAQVASSNESATLIRNHLPFDVDEGIAARAAIGLVVLASDQTIEHEFRLLLNLPGVAFYESRLFNDAVITPASLQAMANKIGPATSMILPGVNLDVVAFGCTAASTVIGEEGVFSRIRRVRPSVRCTTPITGAFAAFDALGARRVAVLTPYRDDVNRRLRDYIEARGYTVRALASFNEEDDNRAARIGVTCIRDAAIKLGRVRDVDMVFVSCTNLRLAQVANEIEAEIGKPVSSSNHAMAWHCLRLAGVGDAQPGFGQLYSTALR